MTSGDARELVRTGYDVISEAYRNDSGLPNETTDEHVDRYPGWIEELSQHVQHPARILDLGCGCGLPADKLLVQRGYAVTGIDFSSTQIERARRLVAGATFIHADFVDLALPSASFEAVISFYALIHVPLADQPPLFARIAEWLVHDGMLLSIIGHGRWTGVEEYLGASMFWDHAEADTTITWMRDAGLNPLWQRFIPEGTGGHSLVMARKI